MRTDNRLLEQQVTQLRGDLRNLEMQLRSAPGASIFPVLRGVPEVVQRSVVPTASDILTTAWAPILIADIRAGLAADRNVKAELLLIYQNNTGSNANVNFRVLINALPVLVAATGVALSNGTAYALHPVLYVMPNANLATARLWLELFSTAAREYASATVDLAAGWTLSIERMVDVVTPAYVTETKWGSTVRIE